MTMVARSTAAETVEEKGKNTGQILQFSRAASKATKSQEKALNNIADMWQIYDSTAIAVAYSTYGSPLPVGSESEGDW